MDSDELKAKISNMVWSYSRIHSFEDCPYKWYLRYVMGIKEEPQFYSSYGSFVHEILERYYKGELPKERMLPEFLSNFSKKVEGERPSAGILQSYIQQGVALFKDYRPLPYDVIAVEKKVGYSINGYKFTGIIDLVGNKEGKLCVIDHKSRKLRQRSGRRKPTAKDEELDEMMKQLYIYAAAIEQEYGRTPDIIGFDCFRNQELIEEPFDQEAYRQALDWAISRIELIIKCTEFTPRPDSFFCNNLCGLGDECCYRELA